MLHARLALAEPEPEPEPEPFRLGQQVEGAYLGQSFTGKIIALSRQGQQYRLTLQFDAPVDTVRFEGFSNLRRRASATVDADGRSPQKTSDGVPQMVIGLTRSG